MNNFKFSITIIFITSVLFLGSGCTNKISSQDQLAVFQAEELCSKSVNEKWFLADGIEEFKKADGIWAVTSHWNKKLGACLVNISRKDEKGFSQTFEDLNGKDYAFHSDSVGTWNLGEEDLKGTTEKKWREYVNSLMTE